MKAKTLLIILFVMVMLPGTIAQSLELEKILCYFKFDGDLLDASPKAVALTQSIGDPITYGEGKFGQAAIFNNMVTVTEGLLFNAKDDFTISAWLNHTQLPSVLNSAQRWIHQMDGDTPGRIHMAVANDNLPTTGTGNVQCRSEQAINENEWFHFANVNDNSAGKRYLYINGTLIAEVVAATEDNAAQFVIGANKNQSGNYALGMIDDLLVTSQVLDAAAINIVMNEGVQAALGATTVGKISAQDMVKIFYQDGRLNILFNMAVTNARYSVFSITGQLVQQGALDAGFQTSIDLKQKRGTYLIQVDADGFSATEKFIAW